MNALGLTILVIVALSAAKVNGEAYITISFGKCPSQLPMIPSFKTDQVSIDLVILIFVVVIEIEILKCLIFY